MAAFFQDHRDTLMKAVETAHARVYWTPYGFALGVSYPAAAPDGLVAAAKAAGKSWAAASVEDRVGVALKTLARINKQSFLMANAVMHTSGQAFMMAFQAGGAHAQDRGLEAVAYAYHEMTSVPGAVRWEKPQGKHDPLVLDKTFRIVPRGVALVIGCSTFPTWNTYPGLFASLVTGNPVIVKPHPSAILPLAITVRIGRQVLAEVLNHRLAVPVAIAILVAAISLVLPSSFYFRIATLVWISAFAVIGLNLLMGYAGQVSLGHAGFFGIGAYFVAIPPSQMGIPGIFAVVFGAVFSGALAFLVGRPILKLKGHYLAVATLGFGILVAMVINNEAWITGGPDGINVPSLGLKGLLKSTFGWKIKSQHLWYWLAGAALVIGAWVAVNLVDSPSGRALRAVHDSEIAAKVAGIDVARMKLIVFVVSAVYASIAGSFLALFNGFITPDAAGFLHSIELVTMVVLGGMGSILGSVVGAAVLVVLPQILTVFHEYEHLLLGLLMMVFMIFLRAGIVPSLRAVLAGRAG